MKNKKKILIYIILITILVIGIFIYLKFYAKKNDNKSSQNQSEIININDKENSILKSDGFEVVDLKVSNISDDSLEVKAKVINKSDQVVKGFFIELGLLDEKENLITNIAENSEKDIKQGEEYILEINAVGIENAKDVKKAKIINIDKNFASNMEEIFDTNEIKSNK